MVVCVCICKYLELHAQSKPVSVPEVKESLKQPRCTAVFHICTGKKNSVIKSCGNYQVKIAF